MRNANLGLKAMALAMIAGVSIAAEPAADPQPATPASTSPASDASTSKDSSRTMEPAVNTSAPAATAPAAPPTAPAASPTPAAAQQAAPAAAPRATRGVQDRLELEATQITGNRELPRVMYVVPWKRADLGDLTGRPVNSLLDEVLAPVDRDVFRRQNRYYEALRPDAPPAAP